MGFWGDNVPEDVPAPRDVYVAHYCICGNVWDVLMNYEMGKYYYYDEDKDPYCPECDAKAE